MHLLCSLYFGRSLEVPVYLTKVDLHELLRDATEVKIDFCASYDREPPHYVESDQLVYLEWVDFAGMLERAWDIPEETLAYLKSQLRRAEQKLADRYWEARGFELLPGDPDGARSTVRTIATELLCLKD